MDKGSIFGASAESTAFIFFVSSPDGLHAVNMVSAKNKTDTKAV